MASEGPQAQAREILLVAAPGEFARHRLKGALRGPERDVLAVATGREGLALLAEVKPDVVLLALDLPDLPGLAAVDAFRDRGRGIPVVALSEAPTVEGAVDALRHGAVDYLGLAEGRTRLLEVVARALQVGRPKGELRRAQQAAHDVYGFSRLVSQSPRMLEVFDQVRAVAATDATVLIRGETGTGKELVSRAIHERSRRKEKPFISVNCGAFTETLLESELFGHEKGSFTGAVGRREGVFEMADGGTLFLDELGETSLNVQVNLLRVLEEMEFRRVGGRDPVHVDVRIVAATNVELENAVRGGRFREDLYYRLDVFPIFLPPLRQRREDIPLLIRHFLDELAEEYRIEPPALSSEAVQAILAYPWPGNVRQLRAMCERWVITRAGQRLDVEHLPSEMRSGGRTTAPPAAGPTLDEARTLPENLDRLGREIERAYLFKALSRCRGHLENTAKHAGITRRTLYTKMKQYGLEADDFKR